jgi:IS30 family transposase
MPDAPLSLCERGEIKTGLLENRDMSWTELGRRIGRHRTSIAREVARNGGRDGYRPAMADQRAERARRRPRPRRLEAPGPLRDRICAESGLGRSPVAVWADLRVEGVEGVPCVETIYTGVYAGVLGVNPTECPRPARQPPSRGRGSASRTRLMR